MKDNEISKEELRICQHCGKMVKKEDLRWTYDKYGIPFEKVCDDCYEKVDKQIKSWTFDPSTGEQLEPDD